MDSWLSKITTYLTGLVTSAFAALLQWVHDAALWLFDGVLSAIATLVAAIPAPSFMTSTNIGTLLSGLPPFALFLIHQADIAAAFGVISAGVVFRLTRKLLTLGQW